MGNSALMPGMRYKDALAAIEFICNAFGFEKHLVVDGEDGSIPHAQLTRGNNCMIMLGSERDDEYGNHFKTPMAIDGVNTQSIYIIVEEIEKHYETAKKAGAEIIKELTAQEYGGKLYSCKDPEGFIWNFGSYNPWA